jgi:hypothetical protein
MSRHDPEVMLEEEASRVWRLAGYAAFFSRPTPLPHTPLCILSERCLRVACCVLRVSGTILLLVMAAARSFESCTIGP